MDSGQCIIQNEACCGVGSTNSMESVSWIFVRNIMPVSSSSGVMASSALSVSAPRPKYIFIVGNFGCACLGNMSSSVSGLICSAGSVLPQPVKMLAVNSSISGPKIFMTLICRMFTQISTALHVLKPGDAVRFYLLNASTSTPAPTSKIPVHSRNDGRSCKNKKAKTATSSRLNLSTGATFDAAPIFNARK